MVRTNRETETIGQGISFERVRRITGYLCKKERFNNAKRQEEKDRVKHGS